MWNMQNNVAKKWPDTYVQRKHVEKTNMQHLECQLAHSMRALRAGKSARLSTIVVQSDESEKQCLHSCLTMMTLGTFGLETRTSERSCGTKGLVRHCMTEGFCPL